MFYHGVNTMQNEATWIVYDYMNRLNLKKLGFTDNFDDLTDFDIDCYNICQTEFDKIGKEESAKQARKAKSRTRRGK